jgi:hypothetical protein
MPGLPAPPSILIDALKLRSDCMKSTLSKPRPAQSISGSSALRLPYAPPQALLGPQIRDRVDAPACIAWRTLLRDRNQAHQHRITDASAADRRHILVANLETAVRVADRRAGAWSLEKTVADLLDRRRHALKFVLEPGQSRRSGSGSWGGSNGRRRRGSGGRAGDQPGDSHGRKSHFHDRPPVWDLP